MKHPGVPHLLQSISNLAFISHADVLLARHAILPSVLVGRTLRVTNTKERLRGELGIVANLSKDVFERRTLTGSGAFFLFICLDAIKFSLQTFFSLLKTIYPRVSTKPLLNDAKSPLPVDVHRSKTLLLKLPNMNKAFILTLSGLRHLKTIRCCILLSSSSHGSGSGSVWGLAES